MFDLFAAFLDASRVTSIETQSNDALLTVMLHVFARDVASESILFQDKVTTAQSLPGATLRRTTAEDATQISAQQLDEGVPGCWSLKAKSQPAATFNSTMIGHMASAAPAR